MCQETLSGTIKEWVVNDYFTPNIKAEVILDTLLTPYIPKILKNQLDIDTILVAKEMSIFTEQGDQGSEDNRGAKIDYVLADKTKDRIYLVELKTTDSSMDAGQLILYASLLDENLDFGKVLGNRLLSILEGSFGIDLGVPAEWKTDTLSKAWTLIWDKRDKYDPKEKVPQEAPSYARMAMELIRSKGWAWRGGLRSRKYVYTLGRLLDYLHSENGDDDLWERRVEPIYLIPKITSGSTLHRENIRTAAFVPYFKKEEVGTFLADTFEEIYGEGKSDV